MTKSQLSRAVRGRNTRESLMSLRPRHLDAVSTFANCLLTMDEILESCMRRYNYLFGRLRPRKTSVPSDAVRQRLIVEHFLQLVQKRRWDLERLAKVRGLPAPIWLQN